jgi:diguanylate cyclase (GGDEF)-like protein
VTSFARVAESNRLRALAVAIAAVLLVGGLDGATGAKASIALFYLFPIGLAAWFFGLRTALVLSGLSATARLAVLWFVHALPASYWNVAVELVFLLGVALVFSWPRTKGAPRVTLAQADLLTGVCDQRGFVELAAVELARARRHQRVLSLAILDIDDFQQVNDRGGPEAGDCLLAEVAETLRRNLRAYDLIGRLGEDQFVLLLPEADDDAAELVLEKLTITLRAATSGHWHAGFSIGAVTIEGPHTTLDHLLEEADKLVLSAKRSGKGRLRHLHLRPNGTEGTPGPDVGFLRPMAYASPAGGSRGVQPISAPAIPRPRERSS